MKRDDHTTIQRVLDGSISPKEFAAFQQRLRNDPELAKAYGGYALLHHTLCEEFEDQPIFRRPKPVAKRKSSSAVGWLAAAAAIAFLAVIFHRKPAVTPAAFASMAKVKFSEDAVWRIEGESRPAGDAVELGKGTTLRLTKGQAELAASGAATAVIEGPSALTVLSGESLRLEDGRGRFHQDKTLGKLEVLTPSMSAVDLGTEFGVETRPGKPDELHVFQGKVELRINGQSQGETLAAGQAARVVGVAGLDHISADDGRFAKQLGKFDTLLGGPFVKSEWRQDYGRSSIAGDRIEGENYAIFHKLPKPEPADDANVLLATLDVAAPSSGQFHTDGWAGLSFFSQGTEVLFFGDAYGPERTWALDVKHNLPVILPAEPLTGPKTVTLRYDRKTGDVSLHPGALPLAPAFCTGTIPPGTTFDEIRLGASSNAALAVRSLAIRTGGETR